MVETIVVIRSLHILFAVLWAGGGIHFQKISKAGLEEGGNLLSFLANSRHGPFMGITALATVGFGLATWMINGGEAYTSAGNAILGVGATGAVIGMGVGFLGHLPNSLRAKRALSSGDGAALESVARRERFLDRLSMASISIALVAMITFRWF